jgi:hypothetical protein
MSSKKPSKREQASVAIIRRSALSIQAATTERLRETLARSRKSDQIEASPKKSDK